jgi:hypothetical protein
MSTMSSETLPAFPTRRASRVSSLLLLVLPVASLGFLAWLPPLIQSFQVRRRRDQHLLVAASGALAAAMAGGMWLVELGNRSGRHSGLGTLGGFVLIGVMGGGVAVTAAYRSRAAEPGIHELPGAREALAERALREEYRDLVAKDPALAREIRVGRPDLTRDYDDGGLLDLNALPEGALVSCAGLSAPQAAEVVRIREQLGRLSSVDELVVYGDFDPTTVDRLKEHSVFL